MSSESRFDSLSVRRETIKHERVLLCEGLQDAAFFKHLIEARNLPKFHIIHPTPPLKDGEQVLRPGDPGGRAGFASRLNSLRFATGFHDVLRSILVVSDKDQDPNGSFEEVRRQLRQVSYIRCPNRPWTVSANGNGLKVVVLMTPCDSETGSLDTMCWNAMARAHPAKFDCVQTMIRCAGIDTWKKNKLDKVLTRTLMAITCEKDPNTSIAWAWSDNRGNMIPLDSECFDAVAHHLKDFDTLV